MEYITRKELKATLPFTLESSGTQSAFILLHRLLPVLSAAACVIDEF
ncbi:MAG: hypothetical protein R3E52_12795 [Burkholderiaceae bacterium]